ncbi:PAS domain-containing sensor histidine kinase [Paucibacter aquatile]|uniref:histidine kinase n=1 Tax=Kinneretia aquatilis TaxID=2070761 RepID=A0A2N8L2X8_9BURK|nr:ATP-binding protein [Paucibacter aquatile]PND40056.1 PAS domain-containing sensor histidine kinase [Paucibacter aquatile]
MLAMTASRFLPSSLIGRVFLLYLTSLLLALSGAIGWFASRSYVDSINGAQDSADTLISLLGPVVSESAVIGDYDTIERALARASKHSDISAALFIDLKGGRIERHAHQDPELRAPSWLSKAIAEQLPELNMAVTAGGKDYGVLRLRFNTAHIANSFWQQSLVAVGLGLLSLLAGLGLVWWPLNRWLGNLGQIRAFGEQLQVSGGALSPMQTEDAPLEFRQTFEVLNQAASSLQLERERAAVTLSAIGDGIASTDAEGRILLANPVLGQLLERAPERLLGERIQELLPDLSRDLDPALDAAREGHWKARLRLNPEGCDAVVLDLSRTPIAGGGWVYAFRDISQQQALDDRLQEELQARAQAMQTMRRMLQDFAATPAQDQTGASRALVGSGSSEESAALLQLVQELIQRLRERGEQLAAIFALSPDGFVSFDAQHICRYVSPAFARLAALPPERALGRHEDELLEAVLSLRAADARAISFQELRSGKLRIELERPTRRVLELALHEGVSSDGAAAAQLLHLSDVTHQVEVEQMKSEFLSTAAHELRTPMASIYGFTELLLMREQPPERQKEMLGRIHRQCQSMIAILNQLLDLARIEARRGQDFELEVLDLQALVQEVVDDFIPPDARALPALSLPSQGCRIHADRQKLQQVLRNLLSNAYKYSPAGGPVELSLSMAGASSDGSAMAVLAVQDHGIGMTEEQLSHVTERFYRADKSGAILGTGLGMSIVKEIVELHGGQLLLASAPGVGTTATVRLPLLAAEPAESL